MHVLVIGGTGFIGSHVSRGLLERNHDVTVLHRGHSPATPGARVFVGDRRNLAASAEALRALAPDVVLDMVLSSGQQARELLDVFRGHAGRIAAVSSMDVYRACGVTHGLEEGPLEPLPLREDTSALRTRLQTYPLAQVRMLRQVFGWLDDDYDKIPVEQAILGDPELAGTVVRLPMVYGPGDPLHRFQPIVKRAVDGRRTILLSATMSEWRATKGYVEDVAAAVVLATVSERAAGRIYNVGEPDTLTEFEWAQHAAGALGWDGELLPLPDDRLPPHLRAPGNTAQHWIADTSRIREELGFAESIPRSDAVGRAVDWERANPPAGFTPHAFDYAAEDAVVRGFH